MPEEPCVLVSKGLTYHILSTLKPGPGKRVYKALRKNSQSSLEQEVILKIFPKKGDFKEEFESLSRTKSPYCVQLLGFESFKGNPAFVLESVQGVTLLKLICHFSLSPPEIHCLLSQIYEGLKDLKKQNLCHGDLSLNNILVSDKGAIKFIDFGLGNYSSSLRGTPPFTAPEVLRGGRPGFLSDLFSLGVLEVFLKNPHKLSALKTKTAGDFVSETEILLHPDPQKRRPADTLLCPEDMSSLGYKVRDILSLLARKNWRTRKLFPARKKPFQSIFLVILALLMGIPSSSQNRAQGFLHIRTHRWVRIQMEGGNRYPPVEIPLPPGTHYLQWNSSEKSGEKVIYIHPGKTLLLTDQDF